MKPREAGGVVDKDLNVYGTEGLKVAGKCPPSFSFVDLEICPLLLAWLAQTLQAQL
jgi:hypothetical protein